MVVGVLLAAGASSRMGSPKALKRTDGQSWVARGVRHLWSVCDSVVVVLGKDAAKLQAAVEEEFTRMVEHGTLHADLQRAHQHGSRGLEVRFTTNPAWKRGMLSSAQVGFADAVRLRPQAVMVLPVDHPDVKPATIADLAGVVLGAVGATKPADRARFAYALVPRYQKRRGHPLVLTPALAKAIVKDAGAEDLSDAVRRNTRMVGYLDVKDAGVVRNANRPGD